MSESRGEYACGELGESITMTPGFAKPPLNSIVAVRAVDWGMETEQYPATAGFTIVRGVVYGQVIKCNDEFISVAMQVFDGGDVRFVLSLPWRTVEEVTILEHAEEMA